MIIPFKEEFEEFLDPITIGTLNKSTGNWTEKHVTVGFFENLNGRRIWIAERDNIIFSHRVFLPLKDDDENDIKLDSSLYIVQKAPFVWSEDTDETLYQVQDRQPFDYYQYALVRTVSY